MSDFNLMNFLIEKEDRKVKQDDVSILVDLFTKKLTYLSTAHLMYTFL